MIFKTYLNDLTKIQGVVNNIENVSAVANGATGLLNPSVVNSLSAAINGLNLQQAQLALSTKHLTAEQMNQVLVQAGLIASENQIQAELVQSALSQAGLSAEKQKAVLNDLKLINTTTGEIITTKACTKEKLLNTLATKDVTGANTEAVISALGLTGANEGLSVSFEVLSASIKSTMVALATNPLTWVIAGLASIATVAYQCSRSIDEVEEKASELNETFSTSKSEIDDYKNRIKDLYETINDSGSSIEDVTIARQDLMVVQDELIDKFGNEKSSIDLITDAINGQTDALDTLTQKQWQATKNEFNDGGFWNKIANGIDGYSDNIDRMLDKYGNYGATIDLSKYGGTLFTEGYEDFKQMLIDDFGAKISDIGSEYIELSGNASEAYQQLLEIQTILEENSSYKPDDGFSKYLGDLANSANDVSEKYEDFYNQYVLYEKIFKEDTYTESFKNINDAYSDYKNAFATGDEDAIKKAQENFANILTQATEGVSDKNVVDYFNNMYPDLQEVVGDWQFEINFTANTEGLKDDVSKYLTKLDGLYEYDLENFNYDAATDEQKEAYDGLVSVARLYGLTIDQLIEKLVQMGLVQSESYQKLVDTFGKENVSKLSPEDLEIAYKIENVGNMTFEEFQQKIEEAKQAAQEASAPKSFKEAWKSLDKDIKDELKELAKAGELTPSVIENNETYAALLQSVGNNAEIAADKINKMVEASDQLSSMKTGISAISDVLAEKKDNLKHKKTKNVGIGADTLAGFDDDLKGLDTWDQFEETLGNGKSSMEECRKAANKLATEWVNSNNFLSQLNDTNQDYYISTLTEMGVENAEAVVTAALAQKKQDLELAEKYLEAAKESTVVTTEDLTKATVNEIDQLANEKSWSEETRKAIYALALQKQTANGIHLNTQADIEQLRSLVYAITGASTALDAWKNYNGAGGTDTAKKKWDAAQKEVNDALNQSKNKTKVSVDVSPSPVNSGSGGNSSKKDKDKTKETKQTFDWLERRVSVLTEKLDLLKAKIENVFSVKKKNSFIDQEISKTNKLIKTYQKQASVYKKQANKSANSKKTETGEDKSRLSKKLKKQIQNGQIKGTRKQLIKTYGEPTANAIQEYQDYWDKYQDARKNIQTAKTDKRNQKIEKHQNWVDHYDALSDKYDAQIEGKATAKEKNKLEDKKIKSTEKSYDHQIKIAEKEYGKKSSQVAALKAEKENAVREIKLEQYQNTQDEADGYRDMLEAQAENATSAAEKNGYLAQEVQYINASYDAQVKEAQARHDSALEAQLQAEWQKTLLDLQIEQLQNLSDEQSAQYDLNQQREANADTAKEKNQYEAESRKNLQSQYGYEMQIAVKNGDLVEQERLRLELEQKIEESYQKQIQNIRDEYDLILGMNDARKSTIESQIAALQANGYGIGTALYERQKSLLQDNYEHSLEEIRRISEEMPNLSGDALKQAEIDLETEKQNVWAIQQSLGEIQKTINDINLSKIERIGTYLEYSAENLEHIQNILSHSDFTLSDKDIGGLTIEGLSNMAVSFAQMSNNSEQIANLYDQIAEKRRQMAESNVEDDQIVAEIDELIQKAHDLEEANYDFGESIKDLVIDSLNSLADALDESISKYKDALQAQKDLYDYRRKVADQLKSIASLEKQLAALQGNETEEARARIQKLQVELEDERQNLKDTEYDKYIQDQEEMLDKVSEDFQDFIASVADTSVSEICRAMSTAVKGNLSYIGTAIESSFAESSRIGDVATSIDGLKEAIENLDFVGNVSTGTDENGNVSYGYKDDEGNKTEISVNNTDAPGTVTGVTVNGENVDLPAKETAKTEAKIESASNTQAASSQYTKSGNNTTGSRTNKNSTSNAEKEKEAQQKKLVSRINEILRNPAKTERREASPSSRMNDPFFKYLYEKNKKNYSYEDEAAIANLMKYPDTDNPYKLGGNSGEYQWQDFQANGEKVGASVLKKFKDLGFSQGGVATELNKVALANGDDGWVTLKRGESVLTPDQTEQFRRLTENLIPLNNIADSLLSVPDYPKITGTVDSSVNIDNVTVEAHLDGSNIVDADSFIKILHNPRVLREVSNGVSSQLGTVMSNRLGRF